MSTVHSLCHYNQTYDLDIKKITFTSKDCEYYYYTQIPWTNFPFELASKNESNGDSFRENSSMLIHHYGIDASDLRFNSVYVQAYTVYSNLFINGVIPFLLVIILNVLIVCNLQKSDISSSPDTIRPRKYLLLDFKIGVFYFVIV